jgi:hypothetical protein
MSDQHCAPSKSSSNLHPALQRPARIFLVSLVAYYPIDLAWSCAQSGPGRSLRVMMMPMHVRLGLAALGRPGLLVLLAE